ncbi:MAG: hypothetical protein ACYDBQ_12135 [Thermoplasmatota archaeon]
MKPVWPPNNGAPEVPLGDGAVVDALTPHEAAAIVGRVRNYSEALNARTAGLIAMSWAGFGPAMILAVALAGAAGLPPLVAGFTWLPIAAAGTAVANAMARDRSIRQRVPYRSRWFWLALAAGAALLALLATAFTLVPALKPLGGVAMVAWLCGLYLTARGVWLGRQPWCRRPWTILFGLGLTAAGVGMALSPLNSGSNSPAAALAAALAVGAAWFAHGWLLHRQG